MLNNHIKQLKSGEIKKMIFDVREIHFRRLLDYVICLTVKKADIMDSFMLKLNFKMLQVDSNMYRMRLTRQPEKPVMKAICSYYKKHPTRVNIVDSHAFKEVWELFSCGRKASIEEVVSCFALPSMLKSFMFIMFPVAGDYFDEDYWGSNRKLLDVFMRLFSISPEKREGLMALFNDWIISHNKLMYCWNKITFSDAVKGLEVTKEIAKNLIVDETAEALAAKVIDKCDKLLHMLNHPYSCRELQELFRSTMNNEVTAEQISDAVFTLKQSDIIGGEYYIFDTNALIQQLQYMSA